MFPFLLPTLDVFSLAHNLPRQIISIPRHHCRQNAGDLIYVPANWKHMTLNIGESIGVGGQAIYGGEVSGLQIVPGRTTFYV